jgi:flagellar protein FliL
MASAAKAGKDEQDIDDEAAEAPPPAAKKQRGPLPMLVGSAVLSALLASGGTWFLTHKHSAEAKPAAAGDQPADQAPAAPDNAAPPQPVQPALYLDLTPAFVVNLADEDAMRFLQVEVQLMARDPKVIDAAKDHMPRIRNALMLLFSQQHAHDIATRAAKEALQKQALDEVTKALQEENAAAAVEAVYFTSFVMQ